MNVLTHPLVLFVIFVVVLLVAHFVINRGAEKKERLSIAQLVTKLNEPAPAREATPVSKVCRRGSQRSANPTPKLAGASYSQFAKNKKRGLSKPRFATA
jgi:hypothetical protein